MATLTATKAQTGIMPKGLRAGLVAVTSTYSLGAALSAGDVIQMIKVPANATPVHVAVWGNAGGAGTVNVGDGVTANRYLTNYLYSAAAVLTAINTQYVPYTYSTDDTIDITVSAISAAANSGGFTMVAIFSMDT